jgi:phosphopantetheine adenylyltransferase/predicted metal-dependent HD superfamily phosphohydrolase
MENRQGFAIYENVESGEIEEVIREILIFRYFITEKIIVQVTFAQPETILDLFSHIYISTYSETDPPVYLVLPQLLGSSFAPDGSFILFNRAFITNDMLRIIPPASEASLKLAKVNNYQEKKTTAENHLKKYNKKYSRAVMGGTFDHMHAGHFIFLTIAASVTDFLAIGLTEATLLVSKSGKEFIQPWQIRKEKVENFLSIIKPSLKVDLFPILDPISKAGTEAYDAIILTTEVEKAFDLVNEKRQQNNLPPLEMVLVDLAVLDQGKISSTDVRKVLDSKSEGAFVWVKERWEDLCFRIGVEREVMERWWDFLSCQYSRKCRFYHTLKHVESILKYLEGPNEVIELSAFFHDLVYIPFKVKEFLSNEISSVRYFQQFVREARIDCPLKERQIMNRIDHQLVCVIIESTIRHLPLTDNQLCKYFLDLDLSILASPTEIYEKYCESIRNEYIHISELDFKSGRKSILESFLNRENLFFSDTFQFLDPKGRSNLFHEISSKLSTSPSL